MTHVFFALNARNQIERRKIFIGDVEVEMFIDSGATCNILDRQLWEFLKKNSVVFLGKTLYDTFPCLVVLTSSSKLKADMISTKLLADSNILASPEAGRGNCLPYV